jgi:DNA polymerase-3 subunit gamma/tau
MSWYRTHRPQTVADLHSPLVRDALQRMQQSGKLQHAYLLTGPRGTGKTSTARILAKMANCDLNKKAIEHPGKDSLKDPCGKCVTCIAIQKGSCLAVAEMDAASNRGIDEIRSLKERVQLAPVDARMSVYIIDEVHMLTTEAFNALLKVLEEPPEHVMFVLATTEFHKVPETIVSRCSVIQYQRATIDELKHALQSVAKREKVELETEALESLISRADGSFRDAIKWLEQAAQGITKVTADTIQKVLQMDSHALVSDLIQELNDRNAQKVAEIFTKARVQDIDFSYFQKQVIEQLHKQLMQKTKEQKNVSALLTLLTTLNVSPDPLLPVSGLRFELACIGWCVQGNETSEPEPIVRHVATEKKEESKEPVEAPTKKMTAVGTGFSDEIWQAVLKQIKTTNTTVEALLHSARPVGIEGTTGTIEVFYPFHKEQLEQEKNKRIVEKAIAVVVSGVTRVAYVLGDRSTRPKKAVEKDADLVDAVAEALG